MMNEIEILKTRSGNTVYINNLKLAIITNGAINLLNANHIKSYINLKVNQ